MFGTYLSDSGGLPLVCPKVSLCRMPENGTIEVLETNERSAIPPGAQRSVPVCVPWPPATSLRDLEQGKSANRRKASDLFKSRSASQCSLLSNSQ